MTRLHGVESLFCKKLLGHRWGRPVEGRDTLDARHGIQERVLDSLVKETGILLFGPSAEPSGGFRNIPAESLELFWL